MYTYRVSGKLSITVNFPEGPQVITRDVDAEIIADGNKAYAAMAVCHYYVANRTAGYGAEVEWTNGPVVNKI